MPALRRGRQVGSPDGNAWSNAAGPGKFGLVVRTLDSDAPSWRRRWTIVVACLFLGAVAGFSVSEALATGHEDAKAAAARLVPGGAKLAPVRAEDPPLWYAALAGASYRVEQSFSETGRTEDELVSAIASAMRDQGWQPGSLDPAPGGASISGTRRDLSATAVIFNKDEPGSIRGIVYVSYSRQPPAAELALAGAAIGGLIGTGWLVKRGRQRR